MLKDLYLFAGEVAIGAVVVIGTVWLLERWRKNIDKPRIRRPLRVRKVKRARYEPQDPKGCRTYPDGKEEAL